MFNKVGRGSLSALHALSSSRSTWRVGGGACPLPGGGMGNAAVAKDSVVAVKTVNMMDMTRDGIATGNQDSNHLGSGPAAGGSPSRVDATTILFVFDVDGCIMDTFNYFVGFMPVVFEKFGVEMDAALQEELRQQILERLAGKSSRLLILQLINKAAKRMGMGLVKRIRFFLYLKDIYRQNINDVPLIDGALETLEFLKGRGHLLALFTSGSRKDYVIKFKGHDRLLSLVDASITRDDVRHMKPDPGGLLKLREQLGLGEKFPLVMVGDMTHDVQAGLNAGGISIGVLTGAGTEDELRAAGAAFVFPSIASIKENIETIESAARAAAGTRGPKN